MKILKRLLIGLLFLIVFATAAFVVWAEMPLEAAPKALSALETDLNVTVTTGDYIAFQPTSVTPATAFVFYPGGRVDYRAYAVPLRKIAEQGFLVILLPVRLNLAFFDVNAADKAIVNFPDIQHWVVGGHSLGGVAAALYASRKNALDGVVFWASYPADDALKNTKMNVLSIYGTRDMGGMDAFDAARDKLPAGTEFVVIDGGNHGQFGDYGFQPGDQEATITRTEQQAQTVVATVTFLESISK